MKDYSGQARRVNFVNIPRELKANASFCVWKMEKRSGKPAKVPYDPRNGQMARTNEPGTFTDFGTAMKACGKRRHCHQHLHGTVYPAERIV